MPTATVTTPTAPTVRNRGATRSLSQTTVAPGDEVIVTIAANYGSFGTVVETLPDGFNYVSRIPCFTRLKMSGSPGRGLTLTFTLFGDIDLSAIRLWHLLNMAGPTPLWGALLTGMMRVGPGTPTRSVGASVVTVDAPVTTATRSLPSRVNPGAALTVRIRVSELR